MSAKPHKSDLTKSFGRSNRSVDAPRDSARRTFLHLSVKKGDTEAVIKLLSFRNANPNQPDKQGRTPLFEAITTRNIEMIALLLKYGAEAAATDSNKRTPAQCAIEEGCDASFLQQLDMLANFSRALGSDGSSALHTAAVHNREDLIVYLLKHGIPVDIADEAGKTALHIAAENKAHKALRYLLKNGANPIERTRQIETALHIAAAAGDETAVDILLAYPAVRTSINEYQTYNDGFTPLLSAIGHDYRNIINKLINIGADINQRDNRGRHSLFIAVQGGYTDLTKLLIERGANVTNLPPSDPSRMSLIHAISANPVDYGLLLQLLHSAGVDINAANYYGLTPLHHAIDSMDKEKALALIDFGADVNIVDRSGRRALDIVVENIPYYSRGYMIGLDKNAYNWLEMVKKLIEHGADVNISPDIKISYSPLHSAARFGLKDVAKLLLENKADVDTNERAGHGCTAFLIALESAQLDVAKLLLAGGADPLKKGTTLRSALHLAAAHGLKEIMEYLFKIPGMKEKINEADVSGMTPLHYVCRRGSSDNVVFLLENGADYKTFDNDGQSPIHYIAQNRNSQLLPILEKILKSAEFTNIKNSKSGETPLHLAIRFWDALMAGQLLKFDADATAKDNTGTTPVHLSFTFNNPEIYKLLVNNIEQKKIPLDQLRDGNGMTPLHITAMNDYMLEGMSFLLDKGSDIKALTTAGETPLHLAVKKGMKQNVEILVKRGADLHAGDAEGRTPLDIALTIDNGADIIKMLREAAGEKTPKSATPAGGKPKEKHSSPPKP